MILCTREHDFFYYKTKDGFSIRINTVYPSLTSLNRWMWGVGSLTKVYHECNPHELLVLKRALIKEMHSNVRMGNK